MPETSSDILTKYARLLVEYCLKLEKDDKLLVLSTYLAEPLLQQVYRQSLKAAAHCEFQIGMDSMQRIFFTEADASQLQFISPRTKMAIEEYDAVLSVMAPFDLAELEDVDPKKKQVSNAARAELTDTMMRRKSEGSLDMCICAYPVQALADEAGMSLAEYEDFVYQACFLESPDPVGQWRQIEKDQQRICDYLDRCGRIRFEGPDIDISFSTKGRKWVNSAGTTNMPSGEVFTGPVEDSVQGRIRFSFPGFFMGQKIEDIMLEVRDGEVVKWQAQKGQSLLDSIFEIEGSRRFGEAAIGTNSRITKLTKNILFDEKIGGTIHMAVGASIPESGGKNKSAVHWDMLADMRTDGRIYADDKMIYENGKFLI